MLLWIVLGQFKSKGAKEVFVIYRRAEAQMPAEQKEIQDAKKKE